MLVSHGSTVNTTIHITIQYQKGENPPCNWIILTNSMESLLWIMVDRGSPVITINRRWTVTSVAVAGAEPFLLAVWRSNGSRPRKDYVRSADQIVTDKSVTWKAMTSQNSWISTNQRPARDVDQSQTGSDVARPVRNWWGTWNKNDGHSKLRSSESIHHIYTNEKPPRIIEPRGEAWRPGQQSCHREEKLISYR